VISQSLLVRDQFYAPMQESHRFSFDTGMRFVCNASSGESSEASDGEGNAHLSIPGSPISRCLSWTFENRNGGDEASLMRHSRVIRAGVAPLLLGFGLGVVIGGCGEGARSVPADQTEMPDYAKVLKQSMKELAKKKGGKTRVRQPGAK
jgi:hypothetical protein